MAQQQKSWQTKLISIDSVMEQVGSSGYTTNTKQITIVNSVKTLSPSKNVNTV